MIDKVKISSFQLAFLLIGFILGSSIVINPAFAAIADAWIVIVLSLLSGIVLIGIYSYSVCAYRVKNGLEVIARVNEILIPFIIFIILLVFFALISRYDVNYFFSVLEQGFKPVLMNSFVMMTFPYGELVAFLYSISMGISQLFKLDDYKPFITPISLITIAMSLWILESAFEQPRWAEEVYPFYALPFQVIIPIIILIISIIKKSLITN